MGKIPLILFSLLLLASCDNKTNSVNVPQLDGKNWAEKLGYPVDSKVVMLHADDIGMCSEANEAVIPYLLNDQIQSAAVMVPCPWFNDIANWYKKHPERDIGISFDHHWSVIAVISHSNGDCKRSIWIIHRG